jgi:hypothetical protein
MLSCLVSTIASTLFSLYEIWPLNILGGAPSCCCPFISGQNGFSIFVFFGKKRLFVF